MKRPIHLRNLPPPDETFNHVELLEFLACWLKPERYLELGVRDGRSFIQIAKYCEEAIAVDVIAPMFTLASNMQYFVGTTDAYFEKISLEKPAPEFDFVFIDADHSHQQSLADFLHVEPYVIDGGFVFFHDTHPCLPYMFNADKSNNCFLTPLYIKTHLIDRWEVLTIPVNPGVTIARKIQRSKQLSYEPNQ